MTSKKSKEKRSRGRPSRRRRRGINPLYVLIPAVAVLLVGVGWLLANITSSPGTSEVVHPVVSESTVAPVFTPRPSSGATPIVGTISSSADMPRVTVQELKAKLDAGQAVVFDARSRTAYDRKHIAGAISMPQGEVAARLAELPTDKLAVFYCT